MMRRRIVSHHELKAEMQAVARGERPAPTYAGQPTFNSLWALLAVIRARLEMA
jgi:hypothetical protein